MAKLTLADITDGDHAAAMNANLALIEAAMENTLSRDGTSPNQMNADLDLNSNFILNMAAGTAATHPLQKQQIEALITAAQAGPTITLNSLTDVVAPSPSVNDVLLFNGTNWVNSPVPGSVTDGTLTNSVLRWSGTAWVEEDQIRISSAGVLTIRNTTGSSDIAISNDGTDVNMAASAVTDINITGLGGRIKQGAETLAFLSEITGAQISGTPTDGQIAVWTGATDIEGGSDFTWDRATNTMDFGAGGTVAFTSGALYAFRDGNLTLDGESTIIPVLSIIQGGINDQSVSITPTAMTFGHTGGGLTFDIGGNLARIETDATLRVKDGGGTDYIQFDHDGTDANITAFQTTDINVTGFSGSFRIDTGFNWTGSQLQLPNGAVGTPAYSFGSETNSGMYYDGQVKWASVGIPVFEMDDTGVIGANVATTWYLVSDELPSGTNPIYTFNTDNNTGIGRNAEDELSLIAGGVEGLRLVGDTTNVLQIHHTNGTITASITQTQGQSPLTSTYNVVTTVANPNDVVTLPTAEQGKLCIVHNDGANNLQIFPASGDDLDMGVNTPMILEPQGTVTFFAVDATDFHQIATSAPANHALQARRTTALTLTTAYVDVTLDTTDVETNSGVIEHNNTNTDDVDIKVSGEYMIIYNLNVDPVTTTNSTITCDARLRIDDTTVVPGSEASQGAFIDSSITGDELASQMSQVAIVNLTAGEKITLQVQKTEIGGTGEQYDVTDIGLKVIRLF